MAANKTIDQVRARIERLRRESMETVAAANKIVYQGVQRIADHELKALNDSYRAALTSIKKSRGGSPKDIAARQIDLLQDTVNGLIANAREAIKIVTETREELARLMQKSMGNEKISVARIDRVANRARKAVKKVSGNARKVAGKTSKKVSGRARSTAHTINRKLDSLSPTPNSRASRATSRAKKAVNAAAKVVDEASQKIENAIADGGQP